MHIFVYCTTIKQRNQFLFFVTTVISSTCGCWHGCCRFTTVTTSVIWTWILELLPCLFHCLNLSHSPQCERWPRGFSANEMSVCEPPSPISPSPPPTLHHMMAWVGLPLWVTQLWGAVLARPLSPVSEPRLMTADDDPVVCPPSHTPSLPASLHRPFNILLSFSLSAFVTWIMLL